MPKHKENNNEPRKLVSDIIFSLRPTAWETEKEELSSDKNRKL